MTDSWATATNWDNPTITTEWTTEPKKSLEPAAVVAMVLAFTSLFFWFVPAVIATFVATGAKRNIKGSEGTRRGRRLATGAQALSAVSIVLAAAAIALISIF